MKNLYPKGKGKIHPTPGSPSGGGGGSAEALDVLKLLPAAILMLTAVLGAEDKEVLAYLITRSINGPAVTGEEWRRCRRLPAGGHQAMLDCGCFDCYTSFWSRWDCSPDRELIHQAIEAFEEHLASSERKGAGGKGRRRERNRSEKGKKGKEKRAEEKVAEESPPATPDAGESFSGELQGDEEAVEFNEEEGVDDEREAEMEDVTGNEIQQQQQQQQAVIGGERRRGWPDVMGVFNSRLWSLWSPGA